MISTKRPKREGLGSTSVGQAESTDRPAGTPAEEGRSTHVSVVLEEDGRVEAVGLGNRVAGAVEGRRGRDGSAPPPWKIAVAFAHSGRDRVQGSATHSSFWTT